MRILDLSAGNRAIWFNKLEKDVIFVDIRPEMVPTVIADTKALPFPDQSFDLIVFDPPHMVHGKTSDMAKRYSSLSAREIRELITTTGAEAYRVAQPDGLMALKWNDHDVRLDHTLVLMKGWQPLFGHDFKRSAFQRSTTYWVLLRKRTDSYQNEAQLTKVLHLDDEEPL